MRKCILGQFVLRIAAFSLSFGPYLLRILPIALAASNDFYIFGVRVRLVPVWRGIRLVHPIMLTLYLCKDQVEW